MGIGNLGNNDFGKLQLTNLNNAKAQKNSKDLANEQIKKEELKNINLNQGVLQADQTDLVQAYFNNDNDMVNKDIAKGEDNSEQPTTELCIDLVSLGFKIYNLVKTVRAIKDIKDQLGQGGNSAGGVLGTDVVPPLTPTFGPVGSPFGVGVPGGSSN